MSAQLAHGVHLVGSFPNIEPEALFRQCGEILDGRVQRVPDGEYGPRAMWAIYQVELFASHPQLEVRAREPGGYGPPMEVVLRPGVEAADVVFDDLGYRGPARESFAIFDRLQRDGAIPSGWRFQVSLPTPLATLMVFFQKEIREAIEPAYEAGMLAEVDAIADSIPHDRLAFQWDTAVEFSLLENMPGVSSWWSDPLGGIVERLGRLGNHVPADIELGYHLCYGDFGHKHWKDPEDASHLVDVANGVSAAVTRTVNWIHMPVIRSALDDTYYEPLKRLKLQPETELYLGLVHHTDGVEGTQHRLALARKFVDGFGVATECGMGRRPPETLTELLQIHAKVAEPVL